MTIFDALWNSDAVRRSLIARKAPALPGQRCSGISRVCEHPQKLSIQHFSPDAGAHRFTGDLRGAAVTEQFAMDTSAPEPRTTEVCEVEEAEEAVSLRRSSKSSVSI